MGAIDLAHIKSPPVKNPLPAKSQVAESVKQSTPNGSFDDLFKEVFNNYDNNSFSKPKNSPADSQIKNTNAKRGEDSKFQVNLTLEEVANGTEKEITFDRYEICSICLGSGEKATEQCNSCKGKGRSFYKKSLNIPRSHTGTKITYPSVGHCGEGGGARGDVHAIISVIQHAIFTRNGSDINIQFPITKRLASQGGIIRVPALKKNFYH